MGGDSGGGGGKGGGGGSSSSDYGQSNYSQVDYAPGPTNVDPAASIDQINAPTVSDNIFASQGATIPLFSSSSTFSASDGGVLPASSAGDTGNTPTSTASIANPSGASTPTPDQSAGIPTPTPAPTSAAPSGISAAAIAPAAANIGGSPTDLTSNVNSDLGLKSPSGTASAPQGGSLLTPDQMGQPSSGGGSSGGDANTAAAPAVAAKKDTGFFGSLDAKSLLGPAVSAAALGYTALQQKNASSISNQASQLAPSELQAVQDYLKSAQQTSQATGPNATAQNAQADQLYSQGQNLVQYLQTGTLPPDAQASLDQATASAKAAIKSRYASQGLNTDPTQNSVLNQELQQVDQQAISSKADLESKYQTAGTQLISAAQASTQTAEQISNNIASQGVAASGLSSDLYKTLVGIDQTSQAQIGAAISNFSKSLSSSGGGTTIKVG